MTQQLSCPPQQQPAIARWSIWFFLGTVLLLLALFIGMLISYLPQVVQLVQSRHARVALPKGPLPRSMLYAEAGQLWIISAWHGTPLRLSTPGYMSNRAVPPLLTPSGEVVYSSGDGVWLTNPFSGHPRRIALVPIGQVITSLALSQDGSHLAWSSAPIDGKGMVNLYAGPLEATVLVHQQAANVCPCFRIFSFLHSAAFLGNNTLLLTEDHGDHNAVQHGLWIFDLNGRVATQPKQLLTSDPPQGPLALTPDSNHLLYTSWEGYTPVPEDGSAPDEIGTLSYANDLHLATINAQIPHLVSSQVIIPEQPLIKNQAFTTSTYHWIMTSRFSPDASMLAYIEFTSSVYSPFTRSSTVYTVDMHGEGTQVTLGSPRLLAIGKSGYTELGDWLDQHTLTLYTNHALYAFNVQHKTLTAIIQSKHYMQIIATVGRR